MSNIFQSLKPEAHLNHNIFDPSARDVFSMKSAMVVPVSVTHTVPDARYEIRTLNTIEINGMPKANFGRFSQYQEWFFVPYSQLWKFFETFYYQRLDTVRNPSNVRTPQLPVSVPHFDMGRMIWTLWRMYLLQRFWLDWKAKNGDYRLNLDPNNLHYTVNDVFYSDLVSGYLEHLSPTEDDVFYDMLNVHGELCVEDILRNFDLLGYGNLLPRFQYAYKVACIVAGLKNNWFHQYHDVLFDITTFWNKSFVDSMFAETYDEVLSTMFDFFASGDARLESYVHSFTTMSDLLLDPDYFLDQDVYTECVTSNTMDHMQPNAWPILAYLKIFADCYRSTQYDDENYSYFYNMDWITNPDSTLIPVSRIVHCLVPRYHLYKRDLFTGLYPNSQFGDTAVVTDEDNWKTLYVRTNDGVSDLKASSAGVMVESPDVQQYYGSTLSSGVVQTTNGSYASAPLQARLQSTISALALRQVEAMQRYKEKQLRAGSRLIDQQKAMFGDTSRYLEDNYVQRIGAVNSPIQIDHVVATSDSVDGTNLGDKGAKAFSVANDFIANYQSHDYGLIIGVMFILPESEYENFGIDTLNTFVQPMDYYRSDFQNLGLAPVISTHFNMFTDQQRVLGYTSRYWPYKTKVSKVHGEFSNGCVFTDYVTPRSGSDVIGSRLPALYASPNDIDRIFYDSETPFQSSDHFKVNSNVQIKAVLPMSVTGLPY